MSVHNAITGKRTVVPVAATSRRKCACCGKRATKKLLADGAAMGVACELNAARWVKNPTNAYSTFFRRNADE